MNKKLLLGLFFFVLIVSSVFVYLFLPQPKIISGSVVRIGEMYSSSEWGITYRRFFFSPKRTVTAAFLPFELQKEGVKVTCPYYVRDVIGLRDVDIIIDGGACINSAPAQLKVVSDGWREYVNYPFGFSINIPEKVYATYVCRDIEYSNLVILENDTVGFGISCGNNVVKVPGPSWNIKVFDAVTDNSQISSIFKELYGRDCEIDPNFTPDGNGSFDVTYIEDGKPLDESLCFINYGFRFKYNPELRKVATWTTGQEANFWKDPSDESYDYEMAQSFKFITQ
jgi:hypothetical protein